MKTSRQTALTFLTSMTLGLTACQDDAELNTGAESSLDLSDGMAGLSLRTGFSSVTQVKKVLYRITPVDDIAGEFEVVVDLNHNLALPAGLPRFENNPLDQQSRHRFTDIFQKVNPGRYKVSVLPLDAVGNPTEECAGATTVDPIDAVAGQVTEESLMLNCRGQDPASINVVTAINHGPTLQVNIVRDTQHGNSNSTCTDDLEVCLTAKDVDNDPLRFELTSQNTACKIQAILTPPQNPPAVPCREITQCYRVKCPGFFGRADLQASVYDQIWSGDTKIDIETWIKDNHQISGGPVDSHMKVNFWGQFEEPDKCEPCPDCDEPVSNFGFSYVLLQDLSDSLRTELPAIQNDIQNLILNLRRDVSSQLNNACPLVNSTWDVVPNGAVASFIDRPKAPFGTPSDYVFKVERGSNPFPSAPTAIANTFNRLRTIGGADSHEGQLQALLAMLGDYSSDRREGGSNDFYLPESPGYLKLAILITKSPYHAGPDCANQALAGTCTQPNDNSPKLGDLEEYPVMAEVAAELKKENVLPIFLVVKDQGAFQTAPYSSLVSARGGGLVVEYTPGDSAGIRAVISEYIKGRITEQNSVCSP